MRSICTWSINRTLKTVRCVSYAGRVSHRPYNIQQYVRAKCGSALGASRAMGTTSETRSEPELYEPNAEVPIHGTGCLQHLFQPSSGDSNDSGLRILLRTLCGIAPVAFSARETPKEVGLVERCKDGTLVRHLTRSALSDCMDGALKIELSGATRVPNEDFPFFDRSDPFVVFTNGVSMVKSSVVNNSRNPRWDSTLYLLIRKSCILSSRADSLMIDMLDKDEDIDGSVSYQHLMDANDRIGNFTIPMEQLKSGGVHSHEIRLLTSNQTQGQTTLTFTTQFITIEDLLTELNLNDPSQWLDASPFEHQGSPWDELGKRLGPPRVSLEQVAFFNFESEGTQAWIHRNTEAKCITLSYRPLQPDRVEDLLTVADITRGYITSIGSADYILQPTEKLNQPGAYIHRGFSTAYLCCHDTILQTVYSLTDWDPTWTVALAGHSLGAALSTVSAFEIANRRIKNGDGPQVGLFNFTSPRVGSREFCSVYNETMPVSFRVRNRQDLIPAIPLTYYHVDQGLVLEENGEIVLERREADFEGTIEEFDRLEWHRNNSQTREAFRRSIRNISELLDNTAHSEGYHYDLVEAIVNHYFNQ